MKLVHPNSAPADATGPMPRHVGLIMDGNGRWASYRGLERTEGHHAGWHAALACARAAQRLGIPWMTFYAFTAENWSRPRDEIASMLTLSKWAPAVEATEKLLRDGVRLHVVGEPSDDPLAEQVFEWLSRLSDESRGNTDLNAVVAFNYAGQDEIVRAVRRIVQAGIPAQDIDRAVLTRHMYVPEMPEVDLVVRTSGEQRLSNFMLWHVSYAEFIFVDTLFPDFTPGHLESAVREFRSRSRRFGGLPTVGAP